MHMLRLHLALGALLLLGLTGGTAAVAEGGAIERTPVTRADVSVPGREAIVMRLELDPGAVAPRHTHPGDEISYVLEGEGELLIDGAPARTLKPGDAFVVPAGTVHGARNTGTVPLRLVGVYVLEKGKALATPAK
jgi:quercetin dioxygenase-like cupin family protein